jgi:hypothetical protein
MQMGYQICSNEIQYVQEDELMIAAIENYKGIEFVRISTLPEEQKRMIWTSEYQHKVIKILRDKELLSDCLPYDNYVEWYEQSFKMVPQLVQRSKELRLAFK